MSDLDIRTVDDWEAAHFEVIVDPLIYRMGQIFLQGAREARSEQSVDWPVLAQDLGALITFFDLLILHERLPALNYTDTFDIGLNFSESLGGLVNRGDQKLLSVDVQYGPYMTTKEAAVEQLRSRIAEGPFVDASVAREILSTIAAVDYRWNPDLLGLEAELPPNQQELARFLLGILVFAGYAQQCGASHVLSPRRSAITAAVGLRSWPGENTEATAFAELARRVQDGGEGWRQRDVPWTPSFLPFLLSQVDPYRTSSSVLLEKAKELGQSRSVQRYRELRAAILSDDNQTSAEATAELEVVAHQLARDMGSSRRELAFTHDVTVEILPTAVGVVAPAIGGAAIAGPVGALVGGLAGAVGTAPLRAVQERLWGWVIDRLPFISARKLLSRAVRAEVDLGSGGELASKLRTVWETT
jgi:hypothetical protein